jgi:hypothetical protein
MDNNGHRDAKIFAPPAAAFFTTAHPLDEKALLLEENVRLRRENEHSHIATRTMASVAVALVRMLNEEGPLDREIIIPRDLYDRLAGAEVGVSEDADRNVIVTIRDDLKHPVWEGR